MYDAAVVIYTVVQTSKSAILVCLCDTLTQHMQVTFKIAKKIVDMDIKWSAKIFLCTCGFPVS